MNAPIAGSQTSVCLGWLVALLLLAGCEEDVVAVLNPAYPFSLYGVLNPQADTQFVRVYPVERTLAPGSTEPLGARLTSTDLSTGEVRVWQEHVSVDTTGGAVYVYAAAFRPQYEHTYRLEITGGRAGTDDTSRVDVRVPVRTNVSMGAPELVGGVRLPVSIVGRPPHVWRSRLELLMLYVNGFTDQGLPLFNSFTFEMPYDDRVEPTDDGWIARVDVLEAVDLASRQTVARGDYICAHRLALLTFSTLVANEDWSPPGGVFDPNQLIEPGVMENVENGFGFVTSGYRIGTPWQPTADVLPRLGEAPPCPPPGR